MYDHESKLTINILQSILVGGFICHSSLMFCNIFSSHDHLTQKVVHPFSDINLTNVFLGQSPKIKAKINQWDLIKQTSFCTAKETLKKKKKTKTKKTLVLYLDT